MSPLECLFFYSVWFIHYLSLHFNENSLVSDSDYYSKGLFSEVPFEYRKIFLLIFFLFIPQDFQEKGLIKHHLYSISQIDTFTNIHDTIYS